MRLCSFLRSLTSDCQGHVPANKVNSKCWRFWWTPERMENVGRTGNLSIFRRVLASVTSINPTQAKCSNLLYRRYDYANYLCLLHLPPEVRKAAFAIRAFNVETARVSFVTLLYYFVTEHYANTHCRVLDYSLCKLTPITRFLFCRSVIIPARSSLE